MLILDKPKLTFEDIIIETTRRCNMKCAHCFRGDAQSVDIDCRYIDNLLDQTEAIGYLEITGGEPTLNLDGLKYLLNGLCKRGIPIFGFSMITNGLIYNEELINMIKWCKKIIDVSCENCISAKSGKYNPAKEIGRCSIGISLDRYHEQHDICMDHYQKYKDTLANYADVHIIAHGNQLHKIGRAKNLQGALDINFKYELSQKQRIEILSKDYTPACRHYYVYRMFHENQKIVCCQVSMDVYGNFANECSNQWDWGRCDAYPKICNVSDSIWDSIIKYNKDKLPCIQFQELQYEMTKKELPFEQSIAWLNNPDAADEPTYLQKEQAAELEKKLYALSHPRSITEAISNMIKEGENYIEVQKNLQKAKEHESKSPKQIAMEARCHSYYEGDKRGELLPPKPTWRFDPSKVKRNPIKTDDGLRCYHCGKVIRDEEGHNIYCKISENGLQCQYCKTINLIERGDLV